MKAIVCAKYGPPEVLHLTEVKKPIPKDKEVLIRVFATTANAADLRLRSADFPPLVQIPLRLMMGFRGPRKKILGVELAGEIEAVGSAVTRFKPGDQIYASSGYALSGYAEYICLAEKAAIAIKPTNMTYEEAAAVPHGALCALHFLRKGNVQHGQNVLIFGASGSIGTYAVQLAKHFGAEVTGVCSTAKVDTVKSLGADHVIDYTKEDFTQNGPIYDAIFDTIGKSPFARSVKSLKENGFYLRAVHLELSSILQGAWTSMTTSKKVIGGVSDSTYTTESLDFLRDLIEAGELKAVIDRSYPLEQMAEAHRYAETGQKTGNIAITVTQTD
jgi:NADPH:quinone reductase-like Zn-dependent oxidoreductase